MLFQGDRVCVVISGSLVVYTAKKESVAPKILGKLSPGDHFGEMSVLADIPRQATVETKSPCLLISISRSHFRNLIKLIPDVGESVQKVMRLCEYPPYSLFASCGHRTVRQLRAKKLNVFFFQTCYPNSSIVSCTRKTS